MKAAIGLLEVDLIIPSSGSLKEKRQVLRSIKDRVRNKFNVSLAEVDYHDQRNRCHLAFITISREKSDAEKRLNRILHLVFSNTGVQVIEHNVVWM